MCCRVGKLVVQQCSISASLASGGSNACTAGSELAAVRCSSVRHGGTAVNKRLAGLDPDLELNNLTAPLMPVDCRCFTTVPHLAHPNHDLVREAGFWRPTIIARMCILWLDGEVECQSCGAVFGSHSAALHCRMPSVSQQSRYGLAALLLSAVAC